MDALLRYTLYEIAYSILIFEFIVMLFCCSAIILIKLISKSIRKKNERIQEGIGNIIESYLFNEQAVEGLQIPKNQCQFRNLVETLERFDHLFNDSRWVEIKGRIVKSYLLDRVKSYSSSFSWSKRQLAVRSLLLCPSLANEKLLEELLDDQRYLVRIAAAVCITRTSYKGLFYKVIYKMSEETILSQFPYRDALIQVNEEKYHWIESLLSSESNKKVCAICLDILSTRYSGNLLPLIKPFVNDSEPACRIEAIKALGNIPSEESIELLIYRLFDSDWKIRVEAVLSIQKLYATQAIPQLRTLLNDPVWWVRLQAALTLKIFGQEGIGVLSSQNKEKDPLAYEIAQYTLALP